MTNPVAYKYRALIYILENNKERACEDLNEATNLGYYEMYGHDVKELIKENCPNNYI